MIQNLKSYIVILFLKILFRAYAIYNFLIFVHQFHWTSSEVLFFEFRFSSRKSQSHQKLAKMISRFTIQFRSKNLIHFTNLKSPVIENTICSQNTVKNLSHFADFQAIMFLFVVRKMIFALYPFLMPKNCILEAL